MKNVAILLFAAMLFSTAAYAHPTNQATQSHIVNKTTVKGGDYKNIGSGNDLSGGRITNKGGKQDHIVNQTTLKDVKATNVGKDNGIHFGDVNNFQ